MLRGDQMIVSIDNAERVRKGVQLRLEGASWDEVATQCGWASRGAAFTQIDRFLRRMVAETATDVEVYRLESLERLRELIKALWPRRADEKVAMAILRIGERMDKLTGAERPTRIEIGESDVDRALRELDEQITERALGAEGEAVPSA